jgi:hypothetical protein
VHRAGAHDKVTGFEGLGGGRRGHHGGGKDSKFE